MLEKALGLKQSLVKVMRGFGRACRGKQRVFVSLVRETERSLLTIGHDVCAVALSAQLCLETGSFSEVRKASLETKLEDALSAHQRIEKQSRLLIHGKKPPNAKIVNAYDPTIAPIKKGKSNCPCQFGKKPGIIAEMATGFILGLHVPEGNPDDAAYVLPLVDRVTKALEQPLGKAHDTRPTIRSVAGDLGVNNKALRSTLNSRGILTVGIPQNIEPIPCEPTPSMLKEALENKAFKGECTKTQVEIAYACGYSRPFVEGIIETLSHRGGTRIKYKGHRGAIIQIGMAVMANNAATLVRIGQNRITKRAQMFRQMFRIKPPKPKTDNAFLKQ